MKVDYIIVGCGLAGINFAELLFKANKTFVIIDDGSQKSSIVAGGLYNPVVLKRFTPVWNSKEQLNLVEEVYSSIEKRLNVKLDYKLSVYRLFASVEEQNNWFLACDKPNLGEFLSPKVISNTYSAINANFGFGEVVNTGRIDTNTLINSYKEFAISSNSYLEESFDYNQLQIISENEINYKDISASKVVFAEGFGLKNNPFFNQLPLNGTKGELLIIHAPQLQIPFVLKSSAFLIPLGDDYYILGATYEWIDKTNTTTDKAKEELLTKMHSFINCGYEVVNQIAAIRPTVKDRRPLVGRHETYKNLFVLNGLGTRGVMIAPYAAKALFNYIENNIELDSEININRFI